MASKKPKDHSAFLRRSGRQKKPIYDTLNQTWLCGQYQDLFSCNSAGTPDSNGSSSRRLAVSASSGSSGRILRRSDRHSREVTALHDNHHVVESDEEETFDIYSRVKRRRRVNSSMHREILYGVESHEESNHSIIDANSNVPSNNSTPKKTDRVESSSDDDSGEEQIKRRYFLRQQKVAPQRFEIVLPEPRKKRDDAVEKGETNDYEQNAFRSPAHKRVKRDILRRRHVRKLEHVSTTSSSDDDADPNEEAERNFEIRKAKGLDRSRSRFLPINMSPKAARTGVYRERIRAGASCADIEPMLMEQSVGFEQVGGLSKHVHSLKEMILFPFLYPEVFEKFKITPPRGVLFYGPPGTGKTLVARALANECSKNGRKISFFMRKGADCLSKWVGESERQLRLLFDQAFTMRPSIIFFDEIDGLAPVRSSRQDQIHSSIVSTLLALMDGLDQRGEVVVIGATNRLDALDPALRRPGRFDRELRFNLPDLNARKLIFKIHTGNWTPPLKEDTVEQLAARSVGYCGADIKGLCTEAALIALRKRYPQIYSSEQKLQLDTNSIEITFDDFLIGMRRVVPAIHRNIGPSTKPLSSHLVPILESNFSLIISKTSSTFRCSASNSIENTTDSLFKDFEKQPLSFTQKILICGDGAGHGQTNHLAPALFHALDHLPVFSLAVPQIFSASYRTAEEAVAEILSNAAKSGPCVLFLPAADSWRNVVPPSAWYTLTSIIESWHSNVSVLILATAHQLHRDLETDVKTLFTTENVVECSPPSADMRRKFFSPLLLEEALKVPVCKQKRMEEVLDAAPMDKPKPFTQKELKMYSKKEKQVLRQLRIFLREILNRLIRDRRFAIFSKPVDPEEAPDYKEVIDQPMDLSAMMTKIDQHKYESVEEFLADIDLITQNALEYNPNRDQTDKLIRHRACALRDVANALIDDELDSDFEAQCLEMKEFRTSRGLDGPIEPPPAFIHTAKSKPLNNVTVHIGCESMTKCQNALQSSEKQNNNLRRRRENIWCRPKRRRIADTNSAKAAAIVQKYRARRQLKLRKNNDRQTASTGFQSDDDQSSEDDKSDSSTRAQIKDHSLLDQSSNFNKSGLDLLGDYGDDESAPPELPVVLCDKAKLGKLTDLIVGRTSGCSVGRLEELYASMIRVVERYVDKFDRRSLTEELDEIIRSVTK